MDSPGTALIGVGAIGVGALLAYGAYKNVPVFGSSGILTQAVTTGRLVAPQATSPQSGGQTGSQKAPAQNANRYLGVWEWVMKNLIGKGIT